MTRLFFNLLIIIGLLIALFGIAVDAIMPGASPGLNLPQALIIAFGAALAVLAFRQRKVGFPRRLKGSPAAERWLIANM